MRKFVSIFLLLYSFQVISASETEDYLKSIKEEKRLSREHIKKISELLSKEQKEFERIYLKSDTNKYQRRLLIASLIFEASEEKSMLALVHLMEQLSIADEQNIDLLNNGLAKVYQKIHQQKIIAIIQKGPEKEKIFRNTLIQNSSNEIFSLYSSLWFEKKISQEEIEVVMASLSSIENLNLIEEMLSSNDKGQKALAELCITKNPNVATLIEARKSNPQIIKKSLVSSSEQKKNHEKNVDDIVLLIKNLKNIKKEEILENQIKIFELYSRNTDLEDHLFNRLDLDNSFENEIFLLCHFRLNPRLSPKYYKTLVRLHDSNEQIRSSAILELKEANDEALLYTFYKLLDDPYPQVREDALDSIYLLVEDKKPFIPKLKKELKVLTKIISLLADADSDVIIGAIQLLVAIEYSPSYDAIVALAYHKDKAVKVSVCDAIAQRTIKTAFAELKMLLNDPLWEIRARAARVFWETDVASDKEIELLLTANKNEKDIYVKSEIIKSLQKSKNVRVIEFWRELAKNNDAQMVDFIQLAQSTNSSADLDFLRCKIITTNEGLGIWLMACARLKYNNCKKELALAFQTKELHEIALKTMVETNLFDKDLVLKSFEISNQNNETKAAYFSYFLKDQTVKWEEKKIIFDKTIKTIDFNTFKENTNKLIQTFVFNFVGNNSTYSLDNNAKVIKEDYYQYFLTFKNHPNLNIKRIFWLYQIQLDPKADTKVMVELLTIHQEDFLEDEPEKLKEISIETIREFLSVLKPQHFEFAHEQLRKLIQLDVLDSYRIELVEKILPKDIFQSEMESLYEKAEKAKKIFYLSFKLESMPWQKIFAELEELRAQKHTFKDFTFSQKITNRLKQITVEELKHFLSILNDYEIILNDWLLGQIGRTWSGKHIQIIYDKIKSDPSMASFYWKFLDNSKPIKDDQLLITIITNVPYDELSYGINDWLKVNEEVFLEWLAKEEMTPELILWASDLELVRDNATIQKKIHDKIYSISKESQAKLISRLLNGKVDEKLFDLYISLIENESTRKEVAKIQISYKHLMSGFSKEYKENFKKNKMKFIKYRIEALEEDNEYFTIKPYLYTNMFDDVNLVDLISVFENTRSVKLPSFSERFSQLLTQKIMGASEGELVTFLLNLPAEANLPKIGISQSFQKLTHHEIDKIKNFYRTLDGNRRLFVISVIFDKLFPEEIAKEFALIASINNENPFYGLLKEALQYKENYKLVSPLIKEKTVELNDDIVKIFVNFDLKMPDAVVVLFENYIKSEKAKYKSEALTYALNQANFKNEPILLWVIEKINAKVVDETLYHAYFEAGDFLPIRINFTNKIEVKAKKVEFTELQLQILETIPPDIRGKITFNQKNEIIFKPEISDFELQGSEYINDDVEEDHPVMLEEGEVEEVEDIQLLENPLSIKSEAEKLQTSRVINESEKNLINQINLAKKNYYFSLKAEARKVFFAKHMHIFNENEFNAEFKALYGEEIPEELNIKVKKAKLYFLTNKTSDELITYFKNINANELKAMRQYLIEFGDLLAPDLLKSLNVNYLKSDEKVRDILKALNLNKMTKSNFTFWLDVMDESNTTTLLPKNSRKFYSQEKVFVSEQVITYFKNGFGLKNLSKYFLVMNLDQTVFDFLPEVIDKIPVDQLSEFLKPFYSKVNTNANYLNFHIKILKLSKIVYAVDDYNDKFPAALTLGFQNKINLDEKHVVYPLLKELVGLMAYQFEQMDPDIRSSYVYEFNGLSFELKKILLDKALKEKYLDSFFISILYNGTKEQVEPYLKFLILEKKNFENEWEFDNFLANKQYVYPWMPTELREKYQKKEKGVLEFIGDLFR